MHRIRPEGRRSAARGVTLIELVLAMVIVGIIVGATIYFAYPLREAADLTTRAALTDSADNALQRISREVRLALPNSVRNPAGCGTSCVEFIPVRTAGRYRAEASGAKCDTGADGAGSDELAFDVADGCFKSIGTVANADTITTSDFLVLNNYGPGFTGQDAYATTDPMNRTNIVQVDEQLTARERVNYGKLTAPLTYASVTFSRTLHDSPGKRFFIVTTPVTYVCSGGFLKRHSGYTYGQTFADVTGATIASNVASCSFDYSASAAAPQVGLLTITLSLSAARSGGGGLETVSLYQSIHVSSVP